MRLFSQLISLVLLLAAVLSLAQGWPFDEVTATPPLFWVNGTGLAISISCNLESGGEPEFGADPASPALSALGISQFLAAHGKRDYLSDSWYEYGIHEGIPRLLA